MSKTILLPTKPGGLALALALGILSTATVSHAVPYASGVTRSGNTVTFILNHDAQGLVVLRNGGNPVYPGTTAGTLSFDMTGYTSYQIIVTGNTTKAWTQYVLDQTSTSFERPFGVSVNKNPSSTNFGKVYVSQATALTTLFGRACSDGIYMLRADGVDAGFSAGGRSWTGNSSPWKSTIGPDGHLYVSDLSNDLAYEFNDDMSVATQLIDASNKTANQWVGGIYVEGTQAQGNRKLYLVDVNNSDTARKGLIMYDLGANATATSGDTGTQIIGPSYYTYYPYDVARDSTGNWYVPQFRYDPTQAPAISKFDGSAAPPINTALWETPRTAPYNGAYGIDINESAGLVAYGNYYDGFVRIFDMASGTYVDGFDAGDRINDVAYDAAGNLVTVDNLTEWARFWSPGGYTVAITKSDGTFMLVTGGTVSVAATDAVASETGPDTGQFTITRTQSASDVTVYFTLTGSATSNVDYTVSVPSPVTILAGQASTNITITPIDDTEREPAETVVLTLQPHGTDYSLGGLSAATVTITDNDETFRYWDGNGTVAGAGAAPTGTWGSDNFWNSIADGTGATGAWPDWAAPVFSAGTDAGTFTVTVNGTQKVDYPSFEEGSVTLSGGTLLLTNWGGIKVADGLTATINSVLNGVSGVTLDGPGTLLVGGANTYAGPTTIKAGTLKLGASGTIPSGAGKGNVSVAGTLDLGGFDQTVNGFSGAGTVDSSGYTGITNVLTVGADNASSAFSGSIKNTGADRVGWTKIGTGTFTFSGNTHTYSGDTTISAGTVSVDANTFFGDETGLLRLAGGTLQMTASHPNAVAFWNSVEMSASSTLTCSSGIGGTWYMRFGDPTVNAAFNMTGGTLTITNSGNTSTTVFDVQFKKMGGFLFARPIVLKPGTRLELCNDDKSIDAVISGPVTGGGQVNYTSWVDATGGNTLATNGNNTYSGGSFLSGGYIGFGADSVGSPGALTSGPIGTGSLTINNDGNLGMFAWDAARTIGNNIIFGNLSDANALHIVGANDLTFLGTVSLGNSNRTVQVDNSGVTTFAGVISGGASGKILTKIGPGKLVFSGNNTYTVPTSVIEGTLLVNNTAGSGTGPGAVSVNPGATLGGTGTIAGGVAAIGATVAPGASAGRLTVEGGLDLSSSTEEWELAANSTSNPGTDFDQIGLTGGNLALGDFSVLMIKFIGTATTPDLANPFWKYSRQWKVISLSGTAANPGNSNFGRIDGTNGITAGTFTTTADGTGATLVYTPSIIISSIGDNLRAIQRLAIEMAGEEDRISSIH